ncbi:Maf-like protein [Betaproteobacteria bacterium]|nr:Maf-like protein [Betaproteobacteria bacterium]
MQFDVLVFRIGERGEDADVDEALHADEKAGHYVERLALTKASAGVKRLLWRKLPRQPVLAADTVIEIDDKIIRKPTDINDACDILQQLSGRSHRVLTAVAISDGEKIRSRISTSEVRFKTLSEDDIHHYIKTGEPMDKAGAYGIQGFAATFIEEIRGSYSGIMGLPLFETAALLTVFDYPL